MAGVEADELLILDRVTEIKTHACHGVTLRADAKQLAFDGVEIVLGRAAS